MKVIGDRATHETVRRRDPRSGRVWPVPAQVERHLIDGRWWEDLGVLVGKSRASLPRREDPAPYAARHAFRYRILSGVGEPAAADHGFAGQPVLFRLPGQSSIMRRTSGRRGPSSRVTSTRCRPVPAGRTSPKVERIEDGFGTKPPGKPSTAVARQLAVDRSGGG